MLKIVCLRSSDFAKLHWIDRLNFTHSQLSFFNGGSITYRKEGRFTYQRENELKSGINFKDGCQNWFSLLGQLYTFEWILATVDIKNVTQNTECVIRWRNAFHHLNQSEEEFVRRGVKINARGQRALKLRSLL